MTIQSPSVPNHRPPRAPLWGVVLGLLLLCSSPLAGQAAHPRILVKHSAHADLIGALVFGADRVEIAPGLTSLVKTRVAPEVLGEMLPEVKAVLGSGETSLVALFNSALVLDARDEGPVPPRFASAEYQEQIRRFYLEGLFSPESPGWLRFRTDPGVIALQAQLSAVEDSADRYLTSFLRLDDEIAFLEGVFGFGFSRYVVVPSALFLPRSGSGVPMRVGEEDWAYFQLGAPRDPGPGTPPTLSNLGFTRTSEISALAVHELAHSFYAIAIEDPYDEVIRRWQSHFTPAMAAQIRDQGYSEKDWPGAFKEYFVRSLEVIFLRQLGRAAEAEDLRATEVAQGFSLIDRVIEGIEEGRRTVGVQAIMESIGRRLQS